MKEQIDARVREGLVKPKEGVELQNFYEGVLHGYTYMDSDNHSRMMAAVEDMVRSGTIQPSSATLQ